MLICRSGESKNIAGIWEELAFKFNKKPDSEVVVAKVDCQAESDLCAYQDISDYPTIKFYRPGADPMGVRYRGVEDLNSVEQFMNRNLGNNAEVRQYNVHCTYTHNLYVSACQTCMHFHIC